MGSRFSKAVKTAPRVRPSKAEVAPPPPTPSERSHLEAVPFQEPLEERDVVFEKRLQAVVGSIEAQETVFVEGSDPASAEAKRKKRREMRQRMLKGRLTVAHFKEILIQHDTVKEAQRQAWIQELAAKYEVDGALLAKALSFYRFPKLTKRYDGYLTADPWY